MLASNRAWSSEEIARTALKIVSNPAGADKLIHAILAGDPRFRRRGSTWQAGRARAPGLAHSSFLLIACPQVAAPPAIGPLFLCPYHSASFRLAEIVRVMPDGEGLEQAAPLLEERLPASLTAQSARRALHRLERTHALPASADRLLDLQALALLLGGDGGTGAGEIEGSRDGIAEARRGLGQEQDGLEQAWADLDACRLALDELLELRGETSLDEIEAELERSQCAEAVDFSRFLFDRELLSRVPARPGIYRFIGEGGRLLYVGKSRDLGRRVASYFRPVAAGHARRARLLADVRSLEWETTPSELEALLLEGETIRRERPPWNQQIDVHDAGERMTAREADLAFVLCEGDPDHVSVFFLRDGTAWGRARLPRSDSEASSAQARAMAAAWLTGLLDPSTGCERMDETDGILVLRYLRHHRDRIDRLHADECSNADEAGEGLVRLATRERPAWEPWVFRTAVDSDA